MTGRRWVQREWPCAGWHEPRLRRMRAAVCRRCRERRRRLLTYGPQQGRQPIDEGQEEADQYMCYHAPITVKQAPKHR